MSKKMTIEEFRATCKHVDSLDVADEYYPDTHGPGWIYLGSLVIEQSTADGDDEAYLIIANCEYSGTRWDLEKELYKWAIDEGFCDDQGRSQEDGVG